MLSSERPQLMIMLPTLIGNFLSFSFKPPLLSELNSLDECTFQGRHQVEAQCREQPDVDVLRGQQRTWEVRNFLKLRGSMGAVPRPVEASRPDLPLGKMLAEYSSELGLSVCTPPTALLWST